jgi:predicted lipoprotein with Yx(FWY)xxD motif
MKLMAVFLVGGLALAACGKDDSSSNAATTTTTTEAPSSSSAAPSATATVSLAAASGSVEAHLVGADGHALYVFEKDHGTTSACTSAQCVATWPALTASGTPGGGSGVDASKLATADGQVADQVTYDGHLLYYFAGDSAPADTNGTKIADWYLVGANGKAIDDD